MNLDQKRIWIFLAFAFGIAWICALIIYLTGGLNRGPLLGASSLRLSLLLLAVVYMPAPALAHVLTRLLTREGWRDLNLRPRLRRGWKFWLACWFGLPVLMLIGEGVYFLLFPATFDSQLTVIQQLLNQTSTTNGVALPNWLTPWAFVALQVAQGVLISPLINGLFTFGEEFGWRAYLLPRLMPLGGRRAMLLTGLIWGLWHAPVIAMGYNYGSDYPGAPWPGILAMIWFCFVTGTVLGWASLRAGSVWPAVIGHAIINGLAALPTLFTLGQPSPLLGPLPLGVIGSLGLSLAALWIFLSPQALAPYIPPAETPTPAVPLQS